MDSLETYVSRLHIASELTGDNFFYSALVSSQFDRGGRDVERHSLSEVESGSEEGKTANKSWEIRMN